MKKAIQIVLLALLVLLGSVGFSSGEVEVVLANEQGEGDDRQAALNNHDVERELQRRRRNGGGGKGKGKGGSKSSKSGGLSGLRFLPDRIEPIPFVNCIPLPPGLVNSKSVRRAFGGSKGKGGKGKGNRRDRRRSGRELRGMMHHHPHDHSSDGRIRTGRNRGTGNRMGGRGHGGRGHGSGRSHHHHAHMHNMRMMGRLPYCPPSAPTIFPTTLPSFTPIPTFTPLPSITPFPSFTPFPTGEDDGMGPSAPGPSPDSGDGGGPPTVPGAPTAPGGGPTGGAPVAIPPGTTRILVESVLQYRLFDTATPRAPTQEEVDGVMAETTRFYTDILTAAYPNLDSFEAVYVEDSFDASAELPIRIDFDANAFFTDGTDIPSAEEVFAVLEGADYQDYITNYVWNSEPVGTTIFFETQEVAYEARVTTGLPA